MAQQSGLDQALRQFEITERNLEKLKRLHAQFENAYGEGQGDLQPELSRVNLADSIYDIWKALPQIDGWKPDIHLVDFNERFIMRSDAQEVGEVGAHFQVEEEIENASETIAMYGHRFKQKRLQLVREHVRVLADKANSTVQSLAHKVSDSETSDFSKECKEIQEIVEGIDVLLGSAFPRPNRWSDLRRHLHFGMSQDMYDIVRHDWPVVYPALRDRLYSDFEPIKIDTHDLGVLVAEKPQGPVTAKLKWDSITAEEFERLIFNLINVQKGYEDADWLTHTNAPDRGRDLSVYRKFSDPLSSGPIRHRVIIQCKHRRSKSVSLDELSFILTQMKSWEPPTVDAIVIATSGRFTSDAVAYVEQHNQGDKLPKIEMWPESHLEMLLAQRPDLIAEFGLR